jgi:hypothetical protein
VVSGAQTRPRSPILPRGVLAVPVTVSCLSRQRQRLHGALHGRRSSLALAHLRMVCLDLSKLLLDLRSMRQSPDMLSDPEGALTDLYLSEASGSEPGTNCASFRAL